MNKYLKWALLLPFTFLVELFCYATNWIACIFVRQEVRTDRVKRIDNQQHTMLRDYPLRFFSLWSTHDNAIDEMWYGLFGYSTKTQADYDNSWWLRYQCRVAWLYRNNAYGFSYAWFGTPVEPLLKRYQHGVERQGFWYDLQTYKNSFQLEVHIPIGSKYFSVNIGWKSHKGFDRKMYANRIPPFGMKSY